MSTVRATSLFVAIVSFTGCGGDAPTPDTPTQADYRVTDRFEVGAGIYVRSLAVEDTNETLWVGTSMGVMEIDLAKQELRNTFTREHGLANEYVFAIGIDSRGFKWFGTNAGGVSRYRDGQWQTFFPMHGLADYWVYAFAEAPGEQMWIGTWDGANKVDLDTLTFSTYRDELVNEWVYGLAVDARGRVWFGTEGGVSMLDGERWSEWTHEDGVGASNDAALPISPNTGLGTRSRHDLSVLVGGQESYNPNYVFSCFVDDQDTVWAGTWGGGVAHYANDKWHNLSMADGLAGNIVYSIAQDASGAMWFGTNRGLSRYDDGDFTNFDKSSGLPGEHVYAIDVSAANDIWVGTLGGVARMTNAVNPEQP